MQYRNMKIEKETENQNSEEKMTSPTQRLENRNRIQTTKSKFWTLKQIKRKPEITTKIRILSLKDWHSNNNPRYLEEMSFNTPRRKRSYWKRKNYTRSDIWQNMIRVEQKTKINLCLSHCHSWHLDHYRNIQQVLTNRQEKWPDMPSTPK